MQVYLGILLLWKKQKSRPLSQPGEGGSMLNRGSQPLNSLMKVRAAVMMMMSRGSSLMA